MLKHHEESIRNLVSYYKDGEGVIAVILDGSIVHGNARPDSDIDAVIVVTEEEYETRKRENRLAEVVTGHCTYEGGYFDVKFKSKKVLELAAERASEPTRNAYLGAVTVYTKDEGIPGIIERISAYPEGEVAAKVRCFNSNLQLNRGYFLACVKEDNAYMRAHLAQEIVYSVYRLILLENRVLFPCNRRLEDTVRACPHRPADILELGAAFLKDISTEKCEAFVTAFSGAERAPSPDDVSENCSAYVHFYEDWWMEDVRPSPTNGEVCRLRFTEDENIRDRVYWYRCAFETKAGERVLAPVGSHDRLQCARVERVLFAEEGDAPYDMALLKDVAAPLGARSFLWEGRTCFELGGVRYDQKRFTRFHIFACLFGEPPASVPAGYALVPVSGGEDFFEREETFELFARLAALREGALLCGEEGTLKLLASALLELAGAQGKARISPLGAEGYLADLGYPKEVLERLKTRLR